MHMLEEDLWVMVKGEPKPKANEESQSPSA
jgi:hypothetical protein